MSPAAEVFKTLLVEGERGLAVGIVPVDRQLDLKAVAAALGLKRVTMADPPGAERATGYVVGGISPIGQKRALPTVLDETAHALRTRLRLRRPPRPRSSRSPPADLVALTRAVTASDRAAEAHSHGVDSTTVVRVETLAAARMRASRSSRSPGVRDPHLEDVVLVAGDRVAVLDLGDVAQPVGHVVGGAGSSGVTEMKAVSGRPSAVVVDDLRGSP